ncbi:MAG: hypothetical protein ABFD25_20525 [Clostridiaceae bacterium]
MLRLKEALKGCGIRQQEVVRVTGFSKAQVSITLSTGKLPAGEEKFKAGVIELAAKTNLGYWLEEHGMGVESLFEVITAAEKPASASPTSADLDTALINYAGLVALGQTLNSDEAISLIRVSRYLLFQVRCLMVRIPDYADDSSIDEIGNKVKALLTGGC